MKFTGKVILVFLHNNPVQEFYGSAYTVAVQSHRVRVLCSGEVVGSYPASTVIKVTETQQTEKEFAR